MTDERRLAIEEEFSRNFSQRGEVGAGLCIWENGQELLQLSGGVTERRGDVAWNRDTLIPIYSATKAVAVTTLLLLMEREGLNPGSRVGRFWPGFAVAGKEDVRVAELLSHQAGVAALDEEVEIGDHEATVGAIERQEPNWKLGRGAHGYHPRSYGAALEELVRLISGGRRLGELWRELVADPYGIDVWVGLPASEFHRVGKLAAPREMLEDEFTKAYLNPGSLTRRAFDSPRGMQRIEAMNGSDGWQLGNPAIGGVASACGLGKFYGLLSVGAIGGDRLMDWLAGEQVSGKDLVLQATTTFSMGMMLGLGGGRGFGHPGAGGSLGFCRPDRAMGFGYVMNQMGAGALPGKRPLALVGAASG